MVLLALKQEIVDTLSDSDRVSLDELVQFSVRLSQVLREPTQRFDPRNGGKVLVAATIRTSPATCGPAPSSARSHADRTGI